MSFLQTFKSCFMSSSDFKVYFHVLNHFTKQGTHQNMLNFKGNNVFACEIAKVKNWNCIKKSFKTLSKSEFMPTHLNILSCNTEDWATKVTKSYESASTTERTAPTPSTLIGKVIFHWRSPRKNLHQPQYLKCTL
jgi:hypothetical protein